MAICRFCDGISQKRPKLGPEGDTGHITGRSCYHGVTMGIYPFIAFHIFEKCLVCLYQMISSCFPLLYEIVLHACYCRYMHIKQNRCILIDQTEHFKVK